MNLDPGALTTGRERFVVLQTGFGEGHRFLATWQAWLDCRDDPKRCDRFIFIAVEPHPPTHADLAAAHRESPWPDLAGALRAAWPPLTPNLHRLNFEGGRVQLLLLVADVQPGLPELVARVDTFWLDGPANGPTPRPWDERVCKALGRLAAPGATLTATNAGPEWRVRLTAAGFSVRPPIGSETLRATFAPSFTPRRAPARSAAPHGPGRSALIVGGGLAGCATSWALAEHGWHSRVLERCGKIASEGSGNPAGLFHGIVNAQHGRHARFNRAAALEARSAIQVAIDRHGVSGSARGLLRLESALDLPAMQAMLTRLDLPPGYVRAVDASAASTHAGIELALPAWFYPGGGWVHPGGLARAFLERAGGHATLRTGVEVQALERTATGWRLLDDRGALIDEAEVVVLANAGDAMRLLAGLGDLGDLGDFGDLGHFGGAAPPMVPVRGQISMLPASAANLPHLPLVPVTGAGYLLPEVNGRAVFGATTQPGDTDASVRTADHAANLAQLERLTSWRPDVEPQHLEGRTGWRWVAADRLPVIGAVPGPPCFDEPQGRALRFDQPRFVPRLSGLFVHTALGSRGITWCALGAQVLASLISGAPAPIEASLLDAVDPARFHVRRVRSTRQTHRSSGA